MNSAVCARKPGDILEQLVKIEDREARSSALKLHIREGRLPLDKWVTDVHTVFSWLMGTWFSYFDSSFLVPLAKRVTKPTKEQLELVDRLIQSIRSDILDVEQNKPNLLGDRTNEFDEKTETASKVTAEEIEIQLKQWNTDLERASQFKENLQDKFSKLEEESKESD